MQARFGLSLLQRLDQAYGLLEERMVPRIPVAERYAERRFVEPIGLMDDVLMDEVLYKFEVSNEAWRIKKIPPRECKNKSVGRWCNFINTNFSCFFKKPLQAINIFCRRNGNVKVMISLLVFQLRFNNL